MAETHFLMVSSMSRFWCSSSSTVSCVILRSPSSFLFTFSTSARTFFSCSRLSSSCRERMGRSRELEAIPVQKYTSTHPSKAYTGPHACEFFCSRESVCFFYGCLGKIFRRKLRKGGTSCIIKKKKTNDKQFSRIDAFNFLSVFPKIGYSGNAHIPPDSMWSGVAGIWIKPQ